MDGHDVLAALQHLASSLHLDTPFGLLIGGSTISLAGLSAYVALKRWKARERASVETLTLTMHTQAEDKNTLLVMPDISGYGQFLSSTTGAEADRADETVVTLLNALIQSVDGRLRVAKLEGDAVLFYVATDALAPVELGSIVLGMFNAFDQRKRQLEEKLALPGLSRLDLKVAVHSGHARRLVFRNSIDLIGADVVLVHRLLKLDLGTRRYVVATQRTAQQIKWPQVLKTNDLDEVVGEFGNVPLTVTGVPDSDKLHEVKPPTTEKNPSERSETSRFVFDVRRANKRKVAA